jgi:hypothetical protein
VAPGPLGSPGTHAGNGPDRWPARRGGGPRP